MAGVGVVEARVEQLEALPPRVSTIVTDWVEEGTRRVCRCETLTWAIEMKGGEERGNVSEN